MSSVDFFAGESVSILAGLRIWSGVKTKCQKPAVIGGVVETSASFLVLMDILTDGNKPVKLWSSKVNSEVSSISGISDLKNIKDMIVEKTSYANSNALEVDDKMNDATPKKTCTRTYVLGSKPSKISFNNLSDGDNNVLILLVSKFSGAKHLLAAELHVLDKCDFRAAKFFMLNVELSAVPGKTNSNKLMAIKKIFYQINGFGGALTPLKFPGIIRSFFTFELSLKKARELAVHEKIVVNVDVRQINKHSDQVFVVKEILVDLPKLAVESVFSKFGKIVSIKMQLIMKFELSKVADLVAARWSVVMGKNSVHVVKAIDNKHILLPGKSYGFHIMGIWTISVNGKAERVGIMAHDFSDLLKSYGGKTCFIGCNSSSYVCNKYAIVCFVDKVSKLAAISSVPVFKSVNLCWAGLFLACCAHCKQFGHISTVCLLGGNSGVHGKWVVISQDWVRLANIYRKKQMPIAHPVSFGGKTWAQIAGGSFSYVISSDFLGSSLSLDTKPAPIDSNSFGNSYLVD
ncbi:hypothetical protein G9A89_023708 [Geosiphon pyriformis]|nr:hypothetical protein G9A89_023708 [Geosiphon pyriformis]